MNGEQTTKAPTAGEIGDALKDVTKSSATREQKLEAVRAHKAALVEIMRSAFNLPLGSGDEVKLAEKFIRRANGWLNRNGFPL